LLGKKFIMSSKIVVIGSSNMDLIMQVERLPKPGETITGGVFSRAFGGKGANQAVGAARAGGQVGFISCLGNDTFATDMLTNFQKDGLDTRYVFQEKEVATGTALITVDSKGENCITVAPGANHCLLPSHLDQAEEFIRGAELVVLQCELHPDTLHYAIDKAATLGKKILLNLAPARPLAEKYLSKLYLLVVNETEAAMLTGLPVNNIEEAKVAAEKLLPQVAGGVIITLGTQGSYVAVENMRELIPAFKVEAVDTTAAGDVYCGSLATALVEGQPVEQAVRFASAAAAIAVTRLGAQPSAPRREEIEGLL
jgi:ribokinase